MKKYLILFFLAINCMSGNSMSSQYILAAADLDYDLTAKYDSSYSIQVDKNTGRHILVRQITSTVTRHADQIAADSLPQELTDAQDEISMEKLFTSTVTIYAVKKSKTSTHFAWYTPVYKNNFHINEHGVLVTLETVSVLHTILVYLWLYIFLLLFALISRVFFMGGESFVGFIVLAFSVIILCVILMDTTSIVFSSLSVWFNGITLIGFALAIYYFFHGYKLFRKTRD